MVLTMGKVSGDITADQMAAMKVESTAASMAVLSGDLKVAEMVQ